MLIITITMKIYITFINPYFNFELQTCLISAIFYAFFFTWSWLNLHLADAGRDKVDRTKTQPNLFVLNFLQHGTSDAPIWKLMSDVNVAITANNQYFWLLYSSVTVDCDYSGTVYDHIEATLNLQSCTVGKLSDF